VYAFEFSTTPPEISTTVSSSTELLDIESISSVVSGEFGGGHNIAILGENDQNNSTLILYSLTSGVLNNKQTVELPFKGGEMISGEFSEFAGEAPPGDEVVIFPAAELGSLQYQ